MQRAIRVALVGLGLVVTVGITRSPQVSGSAMERLVTLGEPVMTTEIGKRVRTFLGAAESEVMVLEEVGSATNIRSGLRLTGAPSWTSDGRIRAATVTPGGSLFLVSHSSTVVRVDPGERPRSLFRVAPAPDSMAVLPDGRVVISAPSGEKLLHLYDQRGRWIRSFGDVRNFVPQRGLNHHLNRGQVLANSRAIYFVFYDAPEPLVLRFNPDGTSLGEERITGVAISAQQPVARRHLENAASADDACAGSVAIIRSAALDHETGHLWLALNGSSHGGIVYELAPDGKKIAEYAFERAGRRIMGADAVEVRSGRGLLTVGTDLFEFAVPGRIARVEHFLARIWASSAKAFDAALMPLVHAQLPCPGQNDGSCALNCNNGAVNNCYQALVGAVNPSYVRYNPSCTTNIDTGRCQAGFSTCNPNTGDRASHSNNIKCACSPCSGSGWTQETQYCSDPDTKDYCNCCFGDISPIVIDMHADGVPFTNASGGVIFSVDGGPTVRRMAWPLTTGADPWLALDRNGNGEIDGVNELFGNMTTLESGITPADGYELLKTHDDNADGWIDGQDGVFNRLMLWSDDNRNGVSESHELRQLSGTAVQRLSTTAVETGVTDEWGNRFALRSQARARSAPRARPTWDVYIKTEAVPPPQ